LRVQGLGCRAKGESERERARERERKRERTGYEPRGTDTVAFWVDTVPWKQSSQIDDPDVFMNVPPA